MRRLTLPLTHSRRKPAGTRSSASSQCPREPRLDAGLAASDRRVPAALRLRGCARQRPSGSAGGLLPAALGVDLLRDPVIRTLLGIRSLPQRLADRLTRRHHAATAAEPPPTFRLTDMVRYGWSVLDEQPNVELVLGQIGHPWKSAGASSGPTVTPAAFADFDHPGFAKIAFNLRVEPYGATASILTIETRVALTDPESLRRFSRYWTFIRPFSALIRRSALRLVAADLRRSGHSQGPSASNDASRSPGQASSRPTGS
jgi:hypothetical protein